MASEFAQILEENFIFFLLNLNFFLFAFVK